jgi:hypothetical protein
MSMHINRFVDRIKAHESRAAKDFVMTMQDARDLHADITKLLMQLQAAAEQKNSQSEVINIEVTGGGFK